MVLAIEPTKEDLWLDPCVGAGAFIAPLRETGIPKDRIVGIDIDPESGAEDHSATTLRGVDFFRWCASTEHRFSRIVANPPYVAIEKLHPELQRSLISLGGRTESSFALRSNYWCAFLAACLRLLARNGNLAFVLPAAWDYAFYASDVREKVLQQFKTVEVHRSLEPLFREVREGCIVLVAKGYLNNPSRSVRVDYGSSQALIAALTPGVSKPTKSYKPLTANDRSLVAFSDLYTTSIGCVTGDARYFLLTESDRVHHGLPRDSVRPVLSRARHLVAAYMTSKEWKRLLRADERVWLFNPEPTILKHKAVSAYLRHGEKICDLEGYKLGHRDPWYSVPDINQSATGFLSGMSTLGPWISLRSMRHLAATNTLYVLTAKLRMSAEERAAWALSLLSNPVRRQFQETARRYPDGLAKLEPRDVGSLRLPTPIRVRGAMEEYERAIHCLLIGRISEAIVIADAFTTRPCV